MQVQIDTKYIWFPVQKGAGREKVHIYLTGEPAVKLFEFDLPVVSERVDYYAALDVEEYLGRTLSISVDFPEDGIGKLEFHDSEPAVDERLRPIIHFTSGFGWINDPNGLFFRDGLYHMYFQYNPYDTKWGNMHWGHAASSDLLHWKQQKTVLFPDEFGTVFSGSALPDKDNATGHGWNAVLFFYTAAGGTNQWSDSRKFTQRMAYSKDGGETLIKVPDFELESIDRENRDPKVFYHAKSCAYIMVLFLDNNDFGIFRSTDLQNWEFTQRITLRGGWECPDLMELPVEGSDRTCWIFWTADGFYFPGTFDGFRFVQTAEPGRAFACEVPYAAQTFSGVSGRVISVSWLRISPRGKPYSGIMSVPSVLSLADTQNGLKLRLALPDELVSKRTMRGQMCLTEAGRYAVTRVPEQPHEITLSISTLSVSGGTAGTVCLNFSGHALLIHGGENRMLLDGQEIVFERCSVLDIDILVDYEVIELRAQNDTLYFVCENEQPALSGQVEILTESSCEGLISVFDIK